MILPILWVGCHSEPPVCPESPPQVCPERPNSQLVIDFYKIEVNKRDQFILELIDQLNAAKHDKDYYQDQMIDCHNQRDAQN